MFNFKAKPNNNIRNNPWNGAAFFLSLLSIWIVVGGIFLALEKNRSIYKAINEQHTPFKDQLFAYITHIGEAPVIIVCLLALLFIKKFRTWKFLLTMIACNISPFLLVQAIKGLINAPRPLKYFPDISFIHQVAGQPLNYDFSFPSGHSEGSFAFLCFLSMILPKKLRFVGIIFFAIGMSVLYSRVYLSQHFYRDVYVGSSLGALCCVLSFWLMKPFKAVEADHRP